MLQNDVNYMFSLDVANRYADDNLTIEFVVNMGTGIDLYYDGENKIPQPQYTLVGWY